MEISNSPSQVRFRMSAARFIFPRQEIRGSTSRENEPSQRKDAQELINRGSNKPSGLPLLHLVSTYILSIQLLCALFLYINR